MVITIGNIVALITVYCNQKLICPAEALKSEGQYLHWLPVNFA